ncbi:MAG: hypothetical protein J6K42_05015 [Clostridia bacterium]|nr:hypothetical protein [Clostridia bacterium]
MEKKLTLEEYIQKLSNILKQEITIDTIKEDLFNNTNPSKREAAKQKIEAYKKYCNLTKESAFDEKDINLSKELYFTQNRNAIGSFADFWFILYDLKSYLLKEIIPDRFIKNSNDSKHNRIISNSIVIPEVIEALGLKSAKYYITNYWDDNADNLYTNLYLVTPNFLQEGEELYNVNDIIGLEVTDVIDLENKLREYYKYSPFSNEQKENLIKQFIKAIVVNKIIDNTDETNENMSIIVNNEKKTVKLSPLYDYDFCCGNQSYKDSKRTINGKSNLPDFINYYKKYPWFEQWLKEKVLTLDIDKILSKCDKKEPNKPTITDEHKRFYKSFFDQKKKIIKECLSPEIKGTNKILDYEQMLEQLNKNQELFAYLNYHSTGGMIFQRPAIKTEKLDVPQEQILEKELFNYLCDRIYCDKKVSAVKQLLEYSTTIKMVSEECAKVFSKFGNKIVDPDGEQYQIKARLLNYVYIEFMEKVESLKKANTREKSKEDYENR